MYAQTEVNFTANIACLALEKVWRPISRIPPPGGVDPQSPFRDPNPEGGLWRNHDITYHAKLGPAEIHRGGSLD